MLKPGQSVRTADKTGITYDVQYMWRLHELNRLSVLSCTSSLAAQVK